MRTTTVISVLLASFQLIASDQSFAASCRDSTVYDRKEVVALFQESLETRLQLELARKHIQLKSKLNWEVTKVALTQMSLSLLRFTTEAVTTQNSPLWIEGNFHVGYMDIDEVYDNEGNELRSCRFTGNDIDQFYVDVVNTRSEHRIIRAPLVVNFEFDAK